MRKSLTVLLMSTLVLASCSTVRSSRLNPFNWFGRAQPAAVSPAENVNPLIPTRSTLSSRPEYTYPGTSVHHIKDLTIDRTPGGAIIRVTGIASVQGAHSVKLDPLNDGEPVDGVMSYRLLAIHPAKPNRVGNEQSRELVVAHFVTNQMLEGVRTIKVSAATNALASRR